MRPIFGLFVTIFEVYYVTGESLENIFEETGYLTDYDYDNEVIINQDSYNNVTVAFSREPCDDQKLKVPDYRMPGRRVSEVKCLEFIWRIAYIEGKEVNKLICEASKIGTVPLIGGKTAGRGEYPHMAALGWKAKVGTWIFKCGSSLISEKFVLTAAHCASVRESDPTVAQVEPQIVRLGSKSILDFVDGKAAYDIGIRRFIKHPRFNPPRQYYDIALVELVEEVTIDWKVHPACLWSEFQNPEKGSLTGWGVIEVGTTKSSPELQYAEISIVDSNECDEKLKIKQNRKWQGIVRHQLCAGEKTGRIDTCSGDSGGPLQSLIQLDTSEISRRVFPWKIYKIIGVTSFGFGCARKDTPSIYTRVASFVGWIENIVWPHNNTSIIEDRFLFET